MNEVKAVQPHPRKLSVVVVCYEMPRQIDNTILSLLPPYQRNVCTEDYEIIIIDNGSVTPLPQEVWTRAANIRYTHIPPHLAEPSPGRALNRGVLEATGELLCVMIDGARMLSPGVLCWGRRLMSFSETAAAEARGWHLGPRFQPESIAEGYNESQEVELLESVEWQKDGYRLFDISAASAQTKSRLSTPASESNCVFLTRSMFEAIGGFDERYSLPGGGLVNLDFYARLVAEVSCVWTILGEGTFHQVHHGAATGLDVADLQAASIRWHQESDAIRGSLPPIDKNKFIVAGHLPVQFRDWLARNA